jgi:hypothetical protein
VFPGTRTRSDRRRSATASSSSTPHAVTRCPHSTWPQRLAVSRPSVRVLYYAAVLLLHNNCGRYPAALAAARSAANYDLVPVCTRNVGVISAAQPVTRPWDRHDERWFATDLAPAGGQHVSGVAPRALRHEARGGGVAVKEGLLRTGVAGPIASAWSAAGSPSRGMADSRVLLHSPRSSVTPFLLPTRPAVPSPGPDVVASVLYRSLAGPACRPRPCMNF